VNVLGDSYGCGIVEHMSRQELKELDEKEDQGKIPESITSMPQISVYQTPNFDSHNENI